MLHRRHTAAKPDGTIIVVSDMGTVERDTLQCVHCGRQWTVQPGSGRRRGFCTYHGGPTCGAPPCDTCLRLAHGMQISAQCTEAYERETRKEAAKAAHRMTTTGEIVCP
jgi:hypothetical protein